MSSQLGQSKPVAVNPNTSIPGYRPDEPANSAWNRTILSYKASGVPYSIERQEQPSKQSTDSQASSFGPVQSSQGTKSTNPELESAIIGTFEKEPSALKFSGNDKGSYLQGEYNKGVLTDIDIDKLNSLVKDYNDSLLKDNASIRQGNIVARQQQLNDLTSTLQEAKSSGVTSIDIFSSPKIGPPAKIGSVNPQNIPEARLQFLNLTKKESGPINLSYNKTTKQVSTQTITQNGMESKSTTYLPSDINTAVIGAALGGYAQVGIMGLAGISRLTGQTIKAGGATITPTGGIFAQSSSIVEKRVGSDAVSNFLSGKPLASNPTLAVASLVGFGASIIGTGGTGLIGKGVTSIKEGITLSRFIGKNLPIVTEKISAKEAVSHTQNVIDVFETHVTKVQKQIETLGKTPISERILGTGITKESLQTQAKTLQTYKDQLLTNIGQLKTLKTGFETLATKSPTAIVATVKANPIQKIEKLGQGVYGLYYPASSKYAGGIITLGKKGTGSLVQISDKIPEGTKAIRSAELMSGVRGVIRQATIKYGGLSGPERSAKTSKDVFNFLKGQKSSYEITYPKEIENLEYVVYHGTGQKEAESILKGGFKVGGTVYKSIFTSPSQDVAKEYAQRGGNPAMLELTLKSTAKILKGADVPIDYSDKFTDMIKYAREKGYDVLQAGILGAKGEYEVSILNPKIIQTVKQIPIEQSKNDNFFNILDNPNLKFNIASKSTSKTGSISIGPTTEAEIAMSKAFVPEPSVIGVGEELTFGNIGKITTENKFALSREIIGTREPIYTKAGSTGGIHFMESNIKNVVGDINKFKEPLIVKEFKSGLGELVGERAKGFNFLASRFGSQGKSSFNMFKKSSTPFKTGLEKQLPLTGKAKSYASSLERSKDKYVLENMMKDTSLNPLTKEEKTSLIREVGRRTSREKNTGSSKTQSFESLIGRSTGSIGGRYRNKTDEEYEIITYGKGTTISKQNQGSIQTPMFKMVSKQNYDNFQILKPLSKTVQKPDTLTNISEIFKSTSKSKSSQRLVPITTTVPRTTTKSKQTSLTITTGLTTTKQIQKQINNPNIKTPNNPLPDLKKKPPFGFPFGFNAENGPGSSVGGGGAKKNFLGNVPEFQFAGMYNKTEIKYAKAGGIPRAYKSKGSAFNQFTKASGRSGSKTPSSFTFGKPSKQPKTKQSKPLSNKFNRLI